MVDVSRLIEKVLPCRIAGRFWKGTTSTGKVAHSIVWFQGKHGSHTFQARDAFFPRTQGLSFSICVLPFGKYKLRTGPSLGWPLQLLSVSRAIIRNTEAISLALQKGQKPSLRSLAFFPVFYSAALLPRNKSSVAYRTLIAVRVWRMKAANKSFPTFESLRAPFSQRRRFTIAH